MKEFLLPIFNREIIIPRIAACLFALKAGKAFRIIIKEELDDRTTQQNKYLNGVPYKLLGEHFGYERDEISEQMCGLYFGWREKKVPRTPHNRSGIRDVPMRTTTTDENGARDVLSTRDFWTYVEFLQRFGAKYGVLIPDPDPNYKHLLREQEQQERAA
jgi:hypothetical protein